MLEGISHLEDLPLNEFIRTVESLKDKVITEKLDGANLWFGLDESGLFTSREGKSPKKGRFYDVTDYPMVANYNAFRATHLALEKAEATIKKHLKEGDMVEIEVLFGRQPNTVTYGVDDKNFIVILRGVNDTPEDRVAALSKALDNKFVSVESTIVSSPDGDQLELNDVSMKWEFTNVKPVNTQNLDTSEANELLSQMKKFMANKNEVLTDMSNQEVAELSLNSVPKDKREQAKAEREKVLSIFLNNYKNPIKEMLLGKFVRKIKPFLQDKNLDPSEDIGVEGVVVRDPVTGSQTKIVDKDVFTAINAFNSATRNSVAGLVRTTNQDAEIDMRGGAFGQAKIRIAELLGAKELALSSGVKRFITKFKADDAATTASALADSLNITNLTTAKTKISAILKFTLSEVNEILGQFKQEAGEFKLSLKTGKEIGITPEVMKRTLTAFAETKKDISTINDRVVNAKTPTELVWALYGKTIEAIFDGASDVKETFNILKTLVAEDDAAASAVEVSSSATVASNISTSMPNLFGTKAVIKRRRNFVKPKKFPAPVQSEAEAFRSSMLKSVTEDWAHVSDMKFATDVDDTAGAQSDVEFNQLRNNVNIGSDISPLDVNKYLDKAHELNDEVDTIAFGMETDDGKITKVYVNSSQAEEFEAALALMLGEKDDLEEVINDMSAKFDIVDVQWPEGYVSKTTGEPINPEATDVPQLDGTEAVELDSEGEPEIDLSTATDGPVDGEESSEEAEIDLSTATDSDESEELKDEPASEDDPVVDDETSSEEEPSEDEDGDEDGDNPDGSKKKRKKKPKTDDDSSSTPKPEKTEESMKSIGQRFLDKLVTESKKPKQDKPGKEDKKGIADEQDSAVKAAQEKQSAALEDLLQSFPAKQEKAIVTLMVSLGAPTKGLQLHKAELKKSIDQSADMYLKNSSFRMWVKKLLNGLSTLDKVTESVLEEGVDFDKRLTNKYQHATYRILKKLGLPDSVEVSSQRALLTGVKNLAKLAIENSDVRVYLLALADELGVKLNDMSEPNAKEVMKEDVTNAYADTLSDFLTSMGFDITSPKSIETQMRTLPAVRTALNKARSNTMAAKRLVAAKDSLRLQTTNAFEAVEKEVPADQGNWIIGDTGSNGLMLKVTGMTLKMDNDECEKLKYILDERKRGTVLSKSAKHYVFTPLKHGSFSVRELDDVTKFPNGILISKEQVEELKEMLATE